MAGRRERIDRPPRRVAQAGSSLVATAPAAAAAADAADTAWAWSGLGIASFVVLLAVVAMGAGVAAAARRRGRAGHAERSDTGRARDAESQRHIDAIDAMRGAVAGDPGGGAGGPPVTALYAAASTVASGKPATLAGGGALGRLPRVEDDRVVQSTVQHQLSRLGDDVVCPDDAEEALEAWTREPTRYLLTDLGLPGRDGVSPIDAIREIERLPGLPACWIVVPTGEPSQGARAREAGADEVRIKPSTIDALAVSLSRAPRTATDRQAIGS